MSSKLRVDVIDPGSPGVDAALLGSLAARPDGCRAIVLGSRRDAELVASAGAEVLANVPIPGRVPWLAGPGLRRALEPIGARTVQTWSESGAVAAIRAGCDPSTLEAHVVAVGSRRPWLEPWMRLRHQVRPVGRELGPELFRRGWNVGPMVGLHELPFAMSTPTQAPDWRRPGAITVAVHVEPADATDFGRISRALVAVTVAGRDITLVMPDYGPRIRGEVRWLHEANRGFGGPDATIIVDDRVRSPSLVGDAVDVVVSIPRRRSRSTISAVSLRSWLGHGIPLVAERDRNTEDLVEDGVDGRLVAPGHRHAITLVLVRLAEDPDLLAGMRHAAAARHGVVPGRIPRRGPVDHADGSASKNWDAAPR